MKIIKTGKKDKPFRMTCNCGCVFEVTRKECHSLPSRPGDRPCLFYKCPECKRECGYEL